MVKVPFGLNLMKKSWQVRSVEFGPFGNKEYQISLKMEMSVEIYPKNT